MGRVNKILTQEEIDARCIAVNPFSYDIKLNEVEAIFKEHAEVSLNVEH